MTLSLLLAGAGSLVPLAWVLGQRVGRATGWFLSIGLAALAGVVLSIWWGRAGSAVMSHVAWMPSLDVSVRLRLDGLGLLFSLVVLVIGAVVMAYTVNYLPHGRHGQFYALLTFFAFAMVGLVLADDVVLLWVFWEFTTVCSFLLIQQSGPRAAGPAVRTLVVTGAGGLALLGAVVLIVTQTGSRSLQEALASPVWHERPALAATTATLVALAAFTKCAQFPFHGWLPDAMVASTPVSAYLHAAAMVKAGVYLLVRFSTAFHDVAVWNGLLVIVGLITALMGAIYALQRFDLKELLAYSTISQLGFLVATIGIGTTYAVLGALAHVLAHAIFKSALFMSVGLIDHEAGTRDLRKLSGLRHAMPASSLALALAAASMAGLPPLLGFITKEAIFKAMSQSPFGLAAAIAISVVGVLVATCTLAYSARMLRPLFGPRMDDPPHEAPVLMVAPVLVGSVAGVVLGLIGPVLAPLVDHAAAAVLLDVPAIDLGLWHGLNVALAMSVLVIVAGSLMVWARSGVDSLLLGRRLGLGTAVARVESFRNGSVALGAQVSKVTHADAPRRHLAVPLVVLVALVAVIGAVNGLAGPTEGIGRRLDWLLTALISVGVGLTLRARSRVALVTTVGIVGFSVALLFFGLGAPDVAITQLLVEILTVAIMVLLLVRLPVLFHPSGRVHTVASAALACGTGAALGVLALAVQDRGPISEVGEEYLARAYELSGGTNVVNTILVDFRAFDTLGEMVVLGVTAIAVFVALESRGLLPHTPDHFQVGSTNPARDAAANAITLRMADRIIGPLLIGLSIWFFLRGHYHPGGGFIGALVAGAAVTLIFLASDDDAVTRLHVNYRAMIGSGITIAVTMGLLGFVDGAFLRPLYAQVAGVQLSTGLVFDLGVYLTVLGLVIGSLSRLGLDGNEPAPLRIPKNVTARKGEGS